MIDEEKLADVENTLPSGAHSIKGSSGDHENGFTHETSEENSSLIVNGHSLVPKPKIFPARDQELLRIIGQFLNDAGLSETASCLTRESQCSLEHPAAAKLRQHVLLGNWKAAEGCLEELRKVVSNSSHVQKMRYLLFEQKYLELLDEDRVLEAIKCLRRDIASVAERQSCCHYLASLAMYPSAEQVRKTTTWPGKGKQSRLQLMDKFCEYLPPSVLLPRNRLKKLMEQSLQHQISNCTYHVVTPAHSHANSSHEHINSCSSSECNDLDLDLLSAASKTQNSSSLSLLTDHRCSKSEFPCRMKQTIMDLEEYLYCKFNHKGNTLAAAGKSAHIQLYTVTVHHRLKPFERKLDNETPVAFFAWSPDDRYLLSCGLRSQSKAIVWNMATLDRLVRVSNTPEDCLSTACWLPNSTQFAVAGIQGHFYLCDLTGNIERSWEGIRVIGLAALHRENTVLAADNHNRVRSYTADMDSTVVQTDKEIISIEVSKCDQFLLCTMKKGGGLQFFHLESGTLLMRLAGLKQEKDFIYSSFGGSPDESYVASGSEDKCVYIWHRSKQLPIAVLSGHTKQVNCVDWNPVIHSMLVSVSDDCTIKVWGPAPPLDSEGANAEASLHNDSLLGGGSSGNPRGFESNEDDDDEDDGMDAEDLRVTRNGGSVVSQGIPGSSQLSEGHSSRGRRYPVFLERQRTVTDVHSQSESSLGSTQDAASSLEQSSYSFGWL